MHQEQKEIAEEIARIILSEQGEPYIFDDQEVFQLKRLMNSDLEQKIDHIESKLDEIHSAFMKSPSDNELSFFAQCREVVKAYNSTSWVLRKLLYIIPAIVVLFTAGSNSIDWIISALKGAIK